MPHSPASPHRSLPARAALLAWRTLALVYLAGLAWITLTPAAVAGQATGIVTVLARALADIGIPFAIGYPVLEFTANIVLFMPFGAAAVFALPLRARAAASTLFVIGAGCLTSTAIELTQLAVPGRVSTVSDVVANTLGTAFGVLLAWGLRALIRRVRMPRASVALESAPPAPPADRQRDSAPPSA